MDYFGSILFGIQSPSWISRFMFLAKLREFSATISSSIFQPCLLSPLLPGLQWHECRIFCYSSKGSLGSVHSFFQSILSLLFRFGHFGVQSSSSLIFSSDPPILWLNPCIWVFTFAVIVIFSSKTFIWDFLGGIVVKNLPANTGDTGSIPGPGRSHMLRSNQARAPQLLSLHTTTTEARTP